jgi:hypothetical protein
MTFDELNIKLSRMIDDPVSTASTDGQRYSSALRVDWLNHSMRNLHKSNLNFESEEGLECSVVNAHTMRNYIKENSYTLSSGETSLSITDVSGVLSAWNTTTNSPILPLGGDKEAVIRNAGLGSYIKPSTLKQYYMIQDGKFVLVSSGVVNNSDTITLMIVTPYIDLVVGGDILFPTEVHNQILNDAFRIYCEEDPSEKNIVRLKAISGG